MIYNRTFLRFSKGLNLTLFTCLQANLQLMYSVKCAQLLLCTCGVLDGAYASRIYANKYEQKYSHGNFGLSRGKVRMLSLDATYACILTFLRNAIHMYIRVHGAQKEFWRCNTTSQWAMSFRIVGSRCRDRHGDHEESCTCVGQLSRTGWREKGNVQRIDWQKFCAPMRAAWGHVQEVERGISSIDENLRVLTSASDSHDYS
jgi:hypothetical protein